MSESRNSHCFDLTFTFPSGLPTRRLIPDQFKWRIAASANVAIVVSVIVDVVLYPAVLLHRAPVPANKLQVLRIKVFSVINFKPVRTSVSSHYRECKILKRADIVKLGKLFHVII